MNEQDNVTQNSEQQPTEVEKTEQQVPPPTTEETAQPSGELTNDEKTMALLAHIGGIITSFVVPLILWLIKKDESSFIGHHCKEALNFQITLMIGWFVAFVLSFVYIGCLLYPVIFIVDVIFGILAAVAANKGELYKYPIAIRIIT